MNKILNYKKIFKKQIVQKIKRYNVKLLDAIKVISTKVIYGDIKERSMEF